MKYRQDQPAPPLLDSASNSRIRNSLNNSTISKSFSPDANEHGINAESNTAAVGDLLFLGSSLAERVQPINSSYHENTTASIELPDFEVDDLFASEFDTSTDLSTFAASLVPHGKAYQQLPAWCSWMTLGVPLSVVTDDPVPDWLQAEMSTSGKLHAHHNADIIIQSLRSFPTQMLRRKTFPWFIHPQSNLFCDTLEMALPETLTTCMSIAQMFVSRTPETIPHLWRLIEEEFSSLLKKVCGFVLLFEHHEDNRLIWRRKVRCLCTSLCRLCRLV